MPTTPVYEVIKPWDNGHCRVRINGVEHDVNHVFMPCHAKAWFRSGTVIRQKYTVLLRALAAGKTK
jgi:hypothetical protein